MGIGGRCRNRKKVANYKSTVFDKNLVLYTESTITPLFFKFRSVQSFEFYRRKHRVLEHVAAAVERTPACTGDVGVGTRNGADSRPMRRNQGMPRVRTSRVVTRRDLGASPSRRAAALATRYKFGVSIGLSRCS